MFLFAQIVPQGLLVARSVFASQGDSVSVNERQTIPTTNLLTLLLTLTLPLLLLPW
jgi:hypothetical protein